MSLQSLVFCSDEKILRVLRRVLSDLEVQVDQCGDADSAIHKLTRRRYEAVIVDCTDEQAATYVLKSARNAPSNKRAVAVAIIDGEKAVRGAFELGAHFVLYKPISMERAKSSFRAAHALMKRERRRNQRVPVEIPVALIGTEGRLETVTVDLGEGGMAVQASKLSKNSKGLRVQFALPMSRAMDTAAEIAWENSSRQTGLRFVDMLPAERQELKRWLEQVSPEEVVKDDPPVSTRLTDLSPAACYLETATPFPVRAKVLLSMRVSETALQVGGIVQVMHPDKGMGVEFIRTTQAQRANLEKFIHVLHDNHGAVAELFVEPEGLETAEFASIKDAGSDPLLELFFRKGDLSPDEFQNELAKQRGTGAASEKSAAAAFSA